MYRQGITSAKIAELAAAPASTVRYHLHAAKKTDPGLEDDHAAARPKPAGPSAAARRMLRDVVAFAAAAGRPPAAHAASPREARLGRWLYLRRREAQQGTLSSVLRDGLDVIPGWDDVAGRKAVDEARWQRRLEQLKTVRDARGDWPRHQKTPDAEERALGVWLHCQRINFHKGKLAPEKESLLNLLLPGWLEGRRRTGGRLRTPQSPDRR